jgi:hypothetical protein
MLFCYNGVSSMNCPIENKMNNIKAKYYSLTEPTKVGNSSDYQMLIFGKNEPRSKINANIVSKISQSKKGESNDDGIHVVDSDCWTAFIKFFNLIKTYQIVKTVDESSSIKIIGNLKVNVFI